MSYGGTLHQVRVRYAAVFLGLARIRLRVCAGVPTLETTSMTV